MTVPSANSERERGLVRVTRPVRTTFQEFAHNEATGGVVLLACAILALVWANSPWSDAYADLWGTYLTIGTGDHTLTMSLGHWVNDGLMAIFFFVVGLEIKRELLVGELASPRQAALPAAAALGGALIPALIYAAFNTGSAGADGWGVPMATDIAFVLGVLALLGDRIPIALKVFLTALAIVDDILAVLVIALFYTPSVSWTSLGAGTAFLAALVIANRLHVRRPLIYGILGIGLWIAVLESGVHATVAGVLLALTIPARTRIDPDEFVGRGRDILDAFAGAGEHGRSILTNGPRQEAVQELEAACEAVEAPLQRLEHTLHPWVTFAIMPLFALANAGVALDGDGSASWSGRVIAGVVAGLVLGKPLGITLFAWLATRSGVASLPAGLRWPQLAAASVLGGIGFTMSLFVADLAFADDSLLTSTKLGILAASAIAGTAGWLVLRRQQRIDVG